MAIRMDRLELVATQMAAMVAELDVEPMLPPQIAAALKLVKRFGRVDLVAMGKGELTTSLRSLPAQAYSDPARAEAVASWMAALLAWVRDETDEPPPDLDL